MAIVVPSQVVKKIDHYYPPAKAHLRHTHTGRLRAIVAMVDRIPEHLLTLQGDDYADFIDRLELVRSRITDITENRSIAYVADPVRQLAELLKKCPDEAPQRKGRQLVFIRKADVRAELALDVDRVHRALSNHEWKAATILAGATIEALLLDRLNRASIQPRAKGEWSRLVAAGTLPNHKRKASSLEEWALADFVHVARGLTLITESTFQLADAARDFRNLIHPGRAIRDRQRCTQGTALAATGAMEQVIEDLSRTGARGV